MDAQTTARIDSWLWAVRQYKTRSAATAACRAGHVRLRDERAKPAQTVRVGDEVRVRVAGFDRILIVKQIIVKRVGAATAAECFDDVSPPRPARVDVPAAIRRDPGTGRPTKRERREIDRLRGR